MTTREFWQNIMHYRGHDRMPVIHWAGWPETRQRWIKEGNLPLDFDEHEYLNAVPQWFGIPVNLNLYPVFKDEILQETDEYRILRTGEGIIQQEWKNKSCIPHYIDFTLKEAKDWPEYKKRLQPHPERIPADIDLQLKKADESGLPIVILVASMMGWIRDWMGITNMSYLMCDEPDVYADMVNTLADLTCWTMDQVIPKMKTRPDMGHGWEDICGKSGPLVSPAIFKKYVAPGYRKIREKLESYGVGMLSIDSDGDISSLVGPWLESGVNVQLPVEIGTWNADPMEFRKKYGKELRIIGGFNKLVLEKGPAEIDAEIERRLPLMKEGGFVMMPDHLITPGTSLGNYKYYLERIRNLRF